VATHRASLPEEATKGPFQERAFSNDSAPSMKNFSSMGILKKYTVELGKCSRHGEGFVPIRNVNMNKNLKKDFLTV
jgi:hypothetical protein